MANVEVFNTGLTETQLTTAFDRALHDMTDAQICALVAAEETARQDGDTELKQMCAELEARVAALEGDKDNA